MSVVRCQVEVSATCRSVVQRNPKDCVVVCDLETSRMGRPWPALGRNATGNKKVFIDISPMMAPLQKPKHVSKVNVNKESLLIKL